MISLHYYAYAIIICFSVFFLARVAKPQPPNNVRPYKFEFRRFPHSGGSVDLRLPVKRDKWESDLLWSTFGYNIVPHSRQLAAIEIDKPIIVQSLSLPTDPTLNVTYSHDLQQIIIFWIADS